MHTVRPLLDQMSVTLSFKNIFSFFCSNFAWFFYSFWANMTQNLLGMTDCLIMTTLCLVFAVPLQVFDTQLKMIADCLKIHFSDNCKITAKTNNTWIQLSLLICSKSYWLRIKRKLCKRAWGIKWHEEKSGMF